MLRQHPGPRAGKADALSLRLPRTPLPDHLIPTGNTDAPSLWLCVCLEAIWFKELCALLLWGWRGPRGRCACSTQLCCNTGLPRHILMVSIHVACACVRACVCGTSRVTGQCGVCDVCVCVFGYTLLTLSSHSPHTLLTLTLTSHSPHTLLTLSSHSPHTHLTLPPLLLQS